MFDILVTIMGDLDSEADALAFAQDLEDCVARARHLGAVVEVWDNRRAMIVRKRTLTLPIDHDPR
ncbi:MAG TPA: hypothetical protein VN809_14955 [Telmatospirillum sp.]|nr:hypothetical protein [Telmatospirillum sp.]